MLLRLISNKLVLKSFSFPSKTKIFIRPSTRLINYKHFRNQIPNLLSISRLGCSFLVGYFIVNHDYHFALLTLSYCGVSDALDGSLARKWNCQTRFADKFLAASLALSLTWIGQLPVHLTSLIILRDSLIVIGALYIWKKHGNQIELKPTNLSKLNTFILVSGLLIHVLNRIGCFNDDFIFYTNVSMTLSTLVSGLYYLKIIKSYL